MQSEHFFFHKLNWRVGERREREEREKERGGGRERVRGGVGELVTLWADLTEGPPFQ